jgi:glycosyltransferase involved in cell wall biosynthesis
MVTSSAVVLLMLLATLASATDDDLPTLHMLSLFHTVPSQRFSHCAFTGKVLRFPKMMRMYGYKVIEYHNGDSESEANEHVQLMSEEEFQRLRKYNNRHDFIGNDAVVGSPLFNRFEQQLLIELEKRVKPRDIVLHPFSWTHKKVSERFSNATHVESGIGYPDTFLAFRIFESWAWYHYHHGTQKNAVGSTYNWVVPNYYDVAEWPFVAVPHEDRHFVFMGRLVQSKGVTIVRDLAARMPDRKFRIAGQGDATRWFGPELTNVEFVGPLEGMERAAFVCNAAAMLMPSSMIEPFGGSAVEAQMCGVPVISTNFGAFTETIEHGVSGFRCSTLGDYLAAVKNVETLNRTLIMERAHRLYSLETVGKQYDAAFRMMHDLHTVGWYTERSYVIGPQPERGPRTCADNGLCGSDEPLQK